MTITRLGIQLGPVTLSFFGLILVAALGAGGFLTYRRARKEGEDAEIVIDLLTWGLILGVVVARLFYVFNPPPSVAELYDRRWYLTHPFDLQVGPFAIWSGGLGMAGALVGGALGVVKVLRQRGADLWRWADLVVAGALPGMSIAAWANVVNQQMYGPPTALPWGISIDVVVPPYDDPFAYPPGTRYHPTPVYLSMWALATWGLVWLIGRHYGAAMRKGDRFLLAVLLYTPGLFMADFLRVDLSRGLLGFSGMQTISLAVFVWAVVMAIRRLRAVDIKVSPQPEGEVAGEK